MKTPTTHLIDFILNQWLVAVSGVALVLTAFYTNHFPAYSGREIEVLFILLVLLVAIRGLEQSGLIARIARRLEACRALGLRLVTTTFFLSMLVTNDIALVVIIPITLSLATDRLDILVILEALAANAGAALTPIGNPQNLYIYWFYGIKIYAFITAIAPFCLVFLVLLTCASLLVKANRCRTPKASPQIDRKAYAYGGLIAIVFLTVLHLLPVASGILVILFALVFDRKALRVDYALLFSFLFFFGIADNLRSIVAPAISRSEHVFLFSALASQVMSNVPATILFAEFTTNWQALLWGANAGGFGSLFGSLANLIAFKMYIDHESTNNAIGFLLKFLAMGYAALFVSAALYFFYAPHMAF